MPYTTQPDYRASSRVSLSRPIRIIHSAQNINAKLLDLSYTGIGILSASPLQEGQHYRLQFSLPDYETEHALELNALAKHINPIRNKYLIGFELPKLSCHEQLIFQSFMHFHQRLQA